MTLCHNVQTATLLINFGFGHVLPYTPFILNFSALHFTHSYPAKEGVPKFCISTHPLSLFKNATSDILSNKSRGLFCALGFCQLIFYFLPVVITNQSGNSGINHQ